MRAHLVPRSKYLDLAILAGIATIALVPRAPGEHLRGALGILALGVLAAAVAASTAALVHRRHGG